jgi:hypothetical protein
MSARGIKVDHSVIKGKHFDVDGGSILLTPEKAKSRYDVPGGVR